MQSLERSFAPRVFTVLERTAKTASRIAKRDGRSSSFVELSVQLHDQLESLFKVQYQRSINVFASRFESSLKAHLPDYIETKESADIFSDEVRMWMSQESAKKAVMVEQTTINQIQKAMIQGFDEGLVGDDLAKLIYQKTGGVIASSRAIVIATTETHNACMYGSLQGAKASEVVKKKVWISAESESTRETHAEADARYATGIGLEEYFQVGSDSMLHPGGGGDPAENINCKCALGYTT